MNTGFDSGPVCLVGTYKTDRRPRLICCSQQVNGHSANDARRALRSALSRVSRSHAPHCVRQLSLTRVRIRRVQQAHEKLDLTGARTE